MTVSCSFMPLCSIDMCVLDMRGLCRVLILAASNDIIDFRNLLSSWHAALAGLAGALGAALLRAHAPFCASQLRLGRPADLLEPSAGGLDVVLVCYSALFLLT